MTKRYTISIFSEHHVGLLNRVTIVFTQRHLNIESITASECEVKNLYRYTIVLSCTEDMAIKVVRQLEKIVDVLFAFYHLDEETVYQEVALYKIPTKDINGQVERIAREHFAQIIAVEQDYLVLQKTGHEEEIMTLFEALKPYNVLEFAKSGRVAITKPMKALSQFLNELDKQHSVN